MDHELDDGGREGGAPGARTNILGLLRRGAGASTSPVAVRIVLPLALFALLLLVPFFVTDVFAIRVLTVASILSILTLGLVVSFGYTGIFNMSQGTFFGIGAYLNAILVARVGIPFEAAMVIAALGTALLGGLVAITTIRVRGDYWALVSMAFTFAAISVFQSWTDVTGGNAGFVGIPRISLFGIDMFRGLGGYFVILVILALVYVFVYRVTRSFAGRAMLATSFDETASSMMGVSTSYFKIMSMVISSGIAGGAGGLLVAINQFIAPGDFDFIASFNIMLFVIVGGTTSLLGGVVATFLLTFVTEQFRNLADYRLAIFGFVLVIAVFVRAGVFAPAFRRLRRALRRKAAEPMGEQA